MRLQRHMHKSETGSFIRKRFWEVHMPRAGSSKCLPEPASDEDSLLHHPREGRVTSALPVTWCLVRPGLQGWKEPGYVFTTKAKFRPTGQSPLKDQSPLSRQKSSKRNSLTRHNIQSKRRKLFDSYLKQNKTNKNQSCLIQYKD